MRALETQKTMSAHPEIKLIVGLGNPGAEYRETRHNAGFWLIDAISRKFGPASLNEESKFKGATGTATIGNRSVRLLMPNTFMNLSGQSVAALANFYKIDIEEILVAHDELDISPGTARLKMGGSHSGHNGLRDIISCMGNQKNFARLRIGIGHPGKASQVSSFVLKKASAKEQQYIEETIDECTRHLAAIISGDWQPVMNTLHGFDADPEARARAEAKELEKERKKAERAAQRAAANTEKSAADESKKTPSRDANPDQEQS